MMSDGTEPTAPKYDQEVSRFLASRAQDLSQVLELLHASEQILSRMAALTVATLRAGGTILTAGNGGSAAEAQHFAAELVGRFKREREPYSSMALTTDTSVLTALGNDYGYEDVFARQVRALARSGDLLLAFSTSGNSENVVRAAAAARERRARVIALTGASPNRLADVADIALLVPSTDTAIVQEVHLMVTHLICGLVEDALAPQSRDQEPFVRAMTEEGEQ
jgi:D-sedoheptulose 7-phosphate isomerase